MSALPNAAIAGWAITAPPTPTALAVSKRRMRNIVREITGVPNLVPGLRANDLVEKYGINRSTAYQVLRRARNLHVKHDISGVEQGRAG